MPPTDTIDEAVTGADGAPAGITNADADAHREPDPEGEKAGESQGSGTAAGTKPDFTAAYEGMTAEEFDAFIQAAPEELRTSSAVLKEERRRGEQSGVTQVRQELESLDKRRGFYDDAIKQRDVADARLGEWFHPEQGVVSGHRARLARALSEGDLEAAEQHRQALDEILGSDDLVANIEAYAQGERAEAARGVHANVRAALAKYEPIIGDLTEQEEAAIGAAIKEDIRKGTSTAQGMFLDVWAGRLLAKGKELGRADAEKDLGTLSKLGERVEAIARAKNGAPRAGTDGAAGGTAEQRRQVESEMRAIDVSTPEGNAEWVRLQPEFQRRLRALDP